MQTFDTQPLLVKLEEFQLVVEKEDLEGILGSFFHDSVIYVQSASVRHLIEEQLGRVVYQLCIWVQDVARNFVVTSEEFTMLLQSSKLKDLANALGLPSQFWIRQILSLFWESLVHRKGSAGYRQDVASGCADECTYLVCVGANTSTRYPNGVVPVHVLQHILHEVFCDVSGKLGNFGESPLPTCLLSEHISQDQYNDLFDELVARPRSLLSGCVGQMNSNTDALLPLDCGALHKVKEGDNLDSKEQIYFVAENKAVYQIIGPLIRELTTAMNEGTWRQGLVSASSFKECVQKILIDSSGLINTKCLTIFFNNLMRALGGSSVPIWLLIQELQTSSSWTLAALDDRLRHDHSGSGASSLTNARLCALLSATDHARSDQINLDEWTQVVESMHQFTEGDKEDENSRLRQQLRELQQEYDAHKVESAANTAQLEGQIEQLHQMLREGQEWQTASKNTIRDLEDKNKSSESQITETKKRLDARQVVITGKEVIISGLERQAADLDVELQLSRDNLMLEQQQRREEAKVKTALDMLQRLLHLMNLSSFFFVLCSDQFLRVCLL